MKDRVAGAPGQYSATVTSAEFNKMRNGEPFAITLKRDDKPEVEGTPYSKAAVLPDDLARRLCPNLEDPSPADAFDALSKGIMPTIHATPDTLADIVSNARPGTAIRLQAGNYGLLTFTGEQGLARAETDNPLQGTLLKHPENLTIIGEPGVKIAGISITSGVANNGQLWESDVSHITLPGGLTIRDVTLTDSFSFRNACIDGLSIIDCDITAGDVHIAPNSYEDNFGQDGTGVTERRYAFQGATVKNLLIKGGTIDNTNAENSNTNHAIYIKVAENITIQGNKISAKGNAIQISGASGRSVCGNIRICDNKILKSKEGTVRISGIKNGYLSVVHNAITNVNMSGTVDKYINITNCVNTIFEFSRRDADGYNTVDGKKIDIGTGIFIAECYDYLTAKNFGEQIGGARKSIQRSGDWIVALNDNYKECWGQFSATLTQEESDMLIVLPFKADGYTTFQITSEADGLCFYSYGLWDDNALRIMFDMQFAEHQKRAFVDIYCMNYTGVQ